MKKYLMIALALTLFAPAVALAQGDENVTKRRPERAVEIQEIREERKDNRQERRSSVAENHASRLERRFGFYFTRLDNIMTRFQKRLDTLTAAGKDTAAVQAKLDAAKAKLVEAKTKGAQAVAAFKAIDPAKFSEQRTEAFAARDLANAARKLFMETHTLLKEALRLLKTISKPALPASSAAVTY
jgi:hypothetical protein